MLEMLRTKKTQAMLLGILDKPMDVADAANKLKLKREYIEECLATLASAGDIVLIRVDKSDYAFSMRGFTALSKRIERFLRKKGSCERMEIVCNITGDTIESFFVFKALGVLIEKNLITETALGRVPNNKRAAQAEKYVYTHIKKPMKSVVIEID